MDQNKGRQIHDEALKANESGDFLRALQLEDEAMLAYQEVNDVAGFSEILAMRTLTINMLGDKANDKSFYLLAAREAQASLDLALMGGKDEQVALAYGSVGRSLDRAEKYREAGESFDKAIEILKKIGYRKAVIADFQNHAATSRLHGGDLTQEQIGLAALADLETAGDASDYEFKVWKSGGLMRLASGLAKNSKKDEAEKYLKQAEEIVVSDPALKVRQEQLTILRKHLFG